MSRESKKQNDKVDCTMMIVFALNFSLAIASLCRGNFQAAIAWISSLVWVVAYINSEWRDGK